jgi:hypothetical protein
MFLLNSPALLIIADFESKTSPPVLSECDHHRAATETWARYRHWLPICILLVLVTVSVCRIAAAGSPDRQSAAVDQEKPEDPECAVITLGEQVKRAVESGTPVDDE